MTVSRRNEPFRFSFEPALACTIRPYEINGITVDSKPAEAELMDLSPRGCKLDCALNFRPAENDCKLVLHFQLTSGLEVRGAIVWQEVRAHGFHYGIQFEADLVREITEELKRYSKQQKQAAVAHE